MAFIIAYHVHSEAKKGLIMKATKKSIQAKYGNVMIEKRAGVNYASVEGDDICWGTLEEIWEHLEKSGAKFDLDKHLAQTGKKYVVGKSISN